MRRHPRTRMRPVRVRSSEPDVPRFGKTWIPAGLIVGRNAEGLLLVDKEAGASSHDVVQQVRRLTRQRRCGHTGTLDPFATGLLILCLGRATRLARFVTEAPKGYRATVRFGVATDTYDCTGERQNQAVAGPSPEALELALEGFRGAQLQTPPPFSAKKVQGKRAYELARQGKAVVLEPVTVTVHDLALVAFEQDRAELQMSVSSGTYVRSLAHDLGRQIGCGAHLEALRRTSIGPFSVDQAQRVAELELSLLEPAAALFALPRFSVSSEAAMRLAHGRPLELEELSEEPGELGKIQALEPGRKMRLDSLAGEFLAVGRVSDSGEVRPVLVWTSPGTKGQTL